MNEPAKPIATSKHLLQESEMINDPIIIIECDRCSDGLEIQPEYKYFSYSGENGAFDCSDDAVMEEARRQGWNCEEDSHICGECWGES